jgi:hypothetical protein
MIDKHGFSDAEWELLVGVPLAVFLVVAHADGSLSPAERRAFASIAEGVAATAEGPQDALLRQVMQEISQDIDQIVEHLDLQMAGGLPWVLSAGRALLDAKADAGQAQAFKEAMIHLAQTIAEAWPRFGRRTTLEERRSIDYVRNVLHCPLPGEQVAPLNR